MPTQPHTEIPCTAPSSSTFSFKAPFPSASTASLPSLVKHRRVSLALPSSPRLVPAWSFRDDTGLESHVAETSGVMSERKGKMRRIADDSDREDVEPQEKKQRKKWTEEETAMLVSGCNKHGVGNWKAILSDPILSFDNRSPVDLKDRFRTHFPDAYKLNYPNAKTHLSSKVRSTLPDGSSLFEKSRSKKRRPFTEEEDRALRAGYEKHGTVWATIVKDPIFQEQNRRSTDLRDRFRNAFPELYQAAGYKPRGVPKKKKNGESSRFPARAATDDQLSMSTSTGPVRRHRAHTNSGLFRGGTKSVPQSTTCSEDEDSSGGEEDTEQSFQRKSSLAMATEAPKQATKVPSEEFVDMALENANNLCDPLSIPDFLPSSQSEMNDSHSQTWSSGIDTPIHSNTWSTTAGSPTSSHLSSDYLMNQSPFHSRIDGAGMIGKSAWGTQDWFSANPRLDTSTSLSSRSSFADGLSPAAPSSPFSFNSLNHGVLDRYDLVPTSLSHDFASEVGLGDTHSTFSDELFPPNGFRGFTHHSNYAGDLIFGARSYQPQQAYYGPGFGFGSAGLGLSGIQSAGIHPMQLHTPALPGIDEIELTGITLNDHVDTPRSDMLGPIDVDVQKDNPEGAMVIPEPISYNLHTLEDMVDLSHDLHSTPPATPLTRPRSMRSSSFHPYTSGHSRSFSVPPSEARSQQSRPPQVHSNSHPELPARGHANFFQPFSGGLFADHQVIQSHSVLAISVPPHPASDSWRPSGDPYDLPFLDLHYYGHTTTQGGGGSVDTDAFKVDSDSSRRGQALDLAQSSLKAPGHAPSWGHYGTPMSSPMVSSGRSSSLHHQRRQSAVTPQDLLFRAGNDNKRKRASWDGGVS